MDAGAGKYSRLHRGRLCPVQWASLHGLRADRRALRGKGIGGRLIVEMANSLAAEGLRPVFLCAPERVRFYTRLGFAKQAEYARYVPEKC